MVRLFLLGAIVCYSTAVDCRGEKYLESLPVVKDEQVIFGQSLWRAKWVAEQPPSDLVDEWGVWALIGECDTPVAPPPCPETVWTDTAIYSNPGTAVNYNGHRIVSRWWVGPGGNPMEDEAWIDLGPCSSSNDYTYPATTTTRVATTASSSTTTTSSGSTSTTTSSGSTTTTTTSSGSTSTTTTSSSSSTTTTPSSGSDIDTSKPTGPNGECIWPSWESKDYCKGLFVTVDGTVYQSSYCTNKKPPGEGWSVAGTCVGDPPRTQWTLEELQSHVDPMGKRYQQVMDPWTPNDPTGAQMLAAEEALKSQVPRDIFELQEVLDFNEVEKIAPGRAENPANVKLVESIVSETLFEYMFPVRHVAYTYVNLLKAVGAFPAYCRNYTDGRNSEAICRKLLATSFAHYAQEVGGHTPSMSYSSTWIDPNHNNPGAANHLKDGDLIEEWRQALWFLREANFSEENSNGAYRESCASANMWKLNYQCHPSLEYFGRGSKQVTHSYNYARLSEAIYGDVDVLLQNPALVADTWLNFASGIWFAVTPQSPKPAMLQVIDGSWTPNDVDKRNGMAPGFAATNDIINGGIECRGSNKAAIANRIAYYKQFSAALNSPIPADEVVDCTGLGGFVEGSAGAVPSYLTRSWTKRECVLTAEQTAFEVKNHGAYEKCFNFFFNSQWMDRDTKQIASSYGDRPGAPKP